jgi:uncharacterized membrane protein HdeD (DUF308 family)
MLSEVSAVARNWWLFVVLGVVCLATGIITIVWPGKTLLVLGVIAGIYLLVAAVLEIIEAIAGEPGNRAFSAILGVLALIAGIICIRRPGESLLALVIVLGVFLIASGVMHIVFAFGDGGPRWGSIVLGALDGIIGIVILAWPGIGLATLAVFFAVTMLIRGAFSVVIGFKLRKLKTADEPPAVQEASFA